MRYITLRLCGFGWLLLNVDGNCDVSHAPLLNCRANGKIDNRFHMRTAHDSIVVAGDIDEKLVKLHILLLEGASKVLELHPGDRKHRLLIQFGIVKAVK